MYLSPVAIATILMGCSVLSGAGFAVLMWFFLGNELRHRRSSNLDALFLQHLSDGALVVDADGMIIKMNHSAQKILKTDSEEMVGSAVASVLRLYGDDEKPVGKRQNPILLFLKNTTPFARQTFRCKRLDNTFANISVSISHLHMENQTPVAVILLRDVSKEDAMNNLKSEFISIASHQLRGPLTHIKWYSDMLLRTSKLDVKQKEYANNIQEATEQMTSLVNDFLDVQRVELHATKTHVESIHLPNLIEHIIESQKLLLDSKKLHVTFENDSKYKTVISDAPFLREILANFVSNAVKYSHPDGDIVLTMRDDGDDFVVMIKDTGIGIPKQAQKEIFSKFFRAGNAVQQGYKGTGLGLYTTRLLLERLGGRVWFESEENVGTTFWVQFPRKQIIV